MMGRFCRYVEKVFELGSRVARLRDSRRRPRISTAAIWLSALFLFVTRCRSLHALEPILKGSRRMDRLIGPVKPSADRIGDVMGLIDPDALREILWGVIRRLGRNKVLGSPWPVRVGVVDGHEFFSLPVSLL
jgi:hypothetical protein